MPAQAAGPAGAQPVQQSVWVAAVSLRRGDAADCARLRQETRQRRMQAAPAWTGRCEALPGLVLRRALEPGDVVLDSDFGAAPAVMRNQRLTALVRVGGVTVEAPVVVLQDGDVGQRVAVRPVDSSARMEAQVSDGGQLIVQGMRQ